ncbi:MAG: TMEM175 family protein, partial [Thermoplasmata archaeon]
MAGDEESTGPPHQRRAQPRSGAIAGEDLGRILALSDGVFAFAMTLLALSLAVPVVGGANAHAVSGNLLNQLGSDGTKFLGYAFAFVMIGIWWIAHNRAFQHIARYDGVLVWINMAILLQIAVMPFVMTVYNSYTDTQTAIGLFAGIQVGLGIST